MKICFLSKMYPPVMGGSGVYAYEIANGLAEVGHEVDIFTQSTTETRAVDIHQNITIRPVVKARRYLVTFETLYFSIRARFAVDFNKYDIIHGTLMPASTIAFSDRLGVDTPIVLTSHSFALSEVFAHSPEKPADYLLKYAFHPMNVVMDNIAARATDKIIAISEEMQNQLITTYGINESKITQISHGVDTERYHPRDHTHTAVSNECLTLLFVGRLISRKRTDLAIKSLAATNVDKIELIIAGSGRLKSNLKQLAQRLGVSDRVKFLGYVPDEELPVLYSSADVTLFTSNYEGFGLVFMESLASGTPVIGTPVGGIPDIIEDGVTGYICDAEAELIASRIERLANCPERLNSMSQAARTEANKRSWRVVSKQIEQVYINMIDNSTE